MIPPLLNFQNIFNIGTYRFSPVSVLLYVPNVFSILALTRMLVLLTVCLIGLRLPLNANNSSHLDTRGC